MLHICGPTYRIDIRGLRNEMGAAREDLGAVKIEVANLRDEMHSSIGSLRDKTHGSIASPRQERSSNP